MEVKTHYILEGMWKIWRDYFAHLRNGKLKLMGCIIGQLMNFNTIMVQRSLSFIFLFFMVSKIQGLGLHCTFIKDLRPWLQLSLWHIACFLHVLVEGYLGLTKMHSFFKYKWKIITHLSLLIIKKKIYPNTWELT